ncbi:MAG: hypothetical protein QNJ53_27025 [Pleurocapsa sp. MO_192.B19]|nr:hypothetical protein [Pleurocapsa sp. MO_192.B19]
MVDTNPEQTCPDPSNPGQSNSEQNLCCVPNSEALEDEDLKLSSLRKFRKLAEKVDNKLQKVRTDHPETEAAAKKLEEAFGKFEKGTFGKLEKEFTGILQIAKDYGAVRESTYEKQLEDSKKNLKDLKDRLGEDKFTKEIDNIHSKDYDDESKKSERVEEINEKLNEIGNKNCLVYSLSFQENRKQDLEEAKIYKDQVKAWFDDLEKLYKEADKYIDQREYRAAYALKVEFQHVLDKKIKDLKTKDKFEKELQEGLKKWILSVYQYFYFNKENLIKQACEKKLKEDYDNAKEKYDTFLKERKELRGRFLEEVQYLEENDLSPDSN